MQSSNKSSASNSSLPLHHLLTTWNCRPPTTTNSTAENIVFNITRCYAQPDDAPCRHNWRQTDERMGNVLALSIDPRRPPSVFSFALPISSDDLNKRESEILWTEYEEAELFALKHKSRILRHLSNPVCGFSMMEQGRLCAVLPMENWLGSSLNQIQGWTTVRESYSRALEQGPLRRRRRWQEMVRQHHRAPNTDCDVGCHCQPRHETFRFQRPTLCYLPHLPNKILLRDNLEV